MAAIVAQAGVRGLIALYESMIGAAEVVALPARQAVVQATGVVQGGIEAAPTTLSTVGIDASNTVGMGTRGVSRWGLKWNRTGNPLSKSTVERGGPRSGPRLDPNLARDTRVARTYRPTAGRGVRPDNYQWRASNQFLGAGAVGMEQLGFIMGRGINYVWESWLKNALQELVVAGVISTTAFVAIDHGIRNRNNDWVKPHYGDPEPGTWTFTTFVQSLFLNSGQPVPSEEVVSTIAEKVETSARMFAAKVSVSEIEYQQNVTQQSQSSNTTVLPNTGTHYEPHTIVLPNTGTHYEGPHHEFPNRATTTIVLPNTGTHYEPHNNVVGPSAGPSAQRDAALAHTASGPGTRGVGGVFSLLGAVVGYTGPAAASGTTTSDPNSDASMAKERPEGFDSLWIPAVERLSLDGLERDIEISGLTGNLMRVEQTNDNRYNQLVGGLNTLSARISTLRTAPTTTHRHVTLPPSSFHRGDRPAEGAIMAIQRYNNAQAFGDNRKLDDLTREHTAVVAYTPRTHWTNEILWLLSLPLGAALLLALWRRVRLTAPLSAYLDGNVTPDMSWNPRPAALPSSVMRELDFPHAFYT